MSEEKVEKTEKTVKKSWFNRVWSAMSGLIVGVAAMFGVNQAQVNEIKNDAQAAYNKVQEIQVAIENKDFAGAISAATDAAVSLKEIVGDVKETINTAKTSFDDYKSNVLEIKTAVDAKDWTTAHGKAVDFAAKLTAAFPGDQLTGAPKTAYDITSKFIADLDAGKYDGAVAVVNNLLALFGKAPATTEAVETK